MIKEIYTKHQAFFNLLFTNVVIGIVRLLQWLANQPDRIGFILKYIGIDLIIFQLICVLLVFIYNWKVNQRFPVIKYFSLILFFVGSPVLLMGTSTFLKSLIWSEGILYELSLKSLAGSISFFIVHFILLAGVYYATRYRINYIRQKEETLKIESLAKDTQLKMLRYQINPHFLFNILNSLHALVDENKEIAKKLIINISDYYRSALDNQNQNNTIAQEIDIVTKYFEIQKIRFDESLDYKIEVDKKTVSVKIPSFVILLLVENAIKYGVKYKDKKLIIKLSIEISQSRLSIIVKNTGKIVASNDQVLGRNNGTGSGIDNIKSRLKLFFDEDVNFSLLDDDEGWVTARIDITNFKNE